MKRILFLITFFAFGLITYGQKITALGESTTATGTSLMFVREGATGDLIKRITKDNMLKDYAKLNSPAFLTQITIGGITITPTSASYLDFTSSGQTQLNLKAPLESPHFTGTVVIPTPFTLGAVSVITNGTRLNYLTSATGTTGDPTSNLVFSDSPTLLTPALGTPSAIVLTNATGTAAGMTAGTVTGFTPAGGSLTLAGADALTLTTIGVTDVTFPTTGTLATTSQLYTNLTSFVDQTAWRVFYSNTDGDVTELALGINGTYLGSNGAAVAPSFSVPAGAGDVLKVGTPVDNQVGIWTGDGTLEGDVDLTFDGTILTTPSITVGDAVSFEDALFATTKTYYMTDYGVTADGVTDETTEVQACLDAAIAAGGYVVFPNGTVIVSSTADSTLNILTIGDNITIIGNDGRSVIKVANSNGCYQSILGKSGAKLSNFTCKGMTFDHNADNNWYADYTPTGAGDRYTITCQSGWENIKLTNNTILNFDGIVSFYFTTASTDEANSRNILINNNRWLDVGVNTANADYDCSVINVTGCDGIITNNLFTKNDWTKGSATTAIETHISHVVVANNNIRRFLVGMNITGISRVGDTEGSVVSNNTMDVCRDGILLWSTTSGAHTTGYGINGLTINGNIIHIRPQYFDNEYSATGYWRGIAFTGTPTLDVNDIKITNNNIIYEEDSNITKYSTTNYGVFGWYTTSTDTKVFNNIEISGNTVFGSPNPAVNCQYSHFNGLVIKNNNFINCGTGRNAGVTAKNSIIYLEPTALLADVIVKDNFIKDDNDTSIVNYIYYLRDRATDAGSYEIRIDNDDYDLMTTTNMNNYIYNYTASGSYDLYTNLKELKISRTYTGVRDSPGTWRTGDQLETVAVMIGHPGQTLIDIAWTSEAGHAEQVLNLGAIIPAKAHVENVFVVCYQAANGVTDITIEVGNTISGAQFIAAASSNAANEVIQSTAVLTDGVLLNWAAASSVYVTGDPTDNNWSDMTTGEWIVYITYRRFDNR